MYLLTFYHLTDDSRQRDRKFGSLDEAIEFGRKSGRYYDIYNTTTARTISWNEIHREQNDEEWFYDESELMWKKGRDMDMDEEEMTRLFYPATKFVTDLV
ncbi:MAG: hypothetical protein M0P58_12530 [Bacteroidales bacterium]|jgi:hypothetical protein|nr:hypothetical protein [Bacteroidales bacterium]